jgi:uncharacterized protein (TIGR02757 family)
LPPPSTQQLNAWLAEYRTPSFIVSDPMQFPALFRGEANPAVVEAHALLAALLAYGRRDLIIASLHNVMDRLGGNLYTYVTQGFSLAKAKRHCKGWVYRFNTADDLAWLLYRLHWAYTQYPTLEALWLAHRPVQASAAKAMQAFAQQLRGDETMPLSYGQRYWLPLPAQGGACKRWWLFLRWVVRTDDDLPAPIDFGLWRTALHPSQLLMPVDTHVSRFADQWQLGCGKATTWRKAEALTAWLAQHRPHDPVAYDFALLGLGVQGNTHTSLK